MIIGTDVQWRTIYCVPAIDNRIVRECSVAHLSRLAMDVSQNISEYLKYLKIQLCADMREFIVAHVQGLR